MIDFANGEITDIVPYNLLTPEVKSLSWAVGKAMQRFRKFSLTSYLYAELSLVPEAILDLMAMELNTQYYDQTMPREVKERLITQTMEWYIHAGTPSVLEEFLKTVFDGGTIREWHQYDGKPYFFKAVVETGDHEIPIGYGAEVIRQIEIYKNVRSWLEKLVFEITSGFNVPIHYDDGVCFQMEFYPRYNLPYLYLDNTWRLLAEKQLNRYNGDDSIDFYPVDMGMEMEIKMEAVLSEGIEFAADIRNSVDAEEGLEIKLDVQEKVIEGEDWTIEWNAKNDVATESIEIFTINRLDQTWKMDRNRKLNGGWELR